MEEEWGSSTQKITISPEQKIEILETRVAKLEETCLYLLDKLEQPVERDIEPISVEKVDDFVEALLETESNNFGWIPDSIEKRLNRRVILLALGAIQQALKTARVEVAGATLTFSMVPEHSATKDVEEGGNIDQIVKVALASLLSSAHVKVLGHEIGFQLE